MTRRPRLVLLLALAACRAEDTPQPKAGPAPTTVRAPDALLPAIAAYRTRVEKRPLPSYGDGDYVEPPTEAELAWIADRATPFESRLTRSMALFDDTKVVMKAYTAGDLERGRKSFTTDGPVTLRWMESIARQFGHVGTVLVEELLPTLSPADPDYEIRMGGLAQMGDGAGEMLRAALIVFDVHLADLEARKSLAIAWRDHAPRYARFIAQPRCDQLRDHAAKTAKGERDASIRDALVVIGNALVRCEGRVLDPAP